MSPPFSTHQPSPCSSPVPRLGTYCLTLSSNSTAELHTWILAWQFRHLISIPSSRLSLISWTPLQITSRSPQSLCRDLEKWGVLASDAKLLVADLMAAVGRADDLRRWSWMEKTKGMEKMAAVALTAAGAAAILLIGAKM